jgi:hypothetical protein
MKVKDLIESTAKVIASIGGVFYFLGFLISIIHYCRFGILAIDFLSSKYILTGGLCIGYTWVNAFIIYMASGVRTQVTRRFS